MIKENKILLQNHENPKRVTYDSKQVTKRVIRGEYYASNTLFFCIVCLRLK